MELLNKKTNVSTRLRRSFYRDISSAAMAGSQSMKTLEILFDSLKFANKTTINREFLQNLQNLLSSDSSQQAFRATAYCLCFALGVDLFENPDT